MPIRVKPELFQFRGIFGHPLVTQIDTRLTFKRRIDLDEAVVDGMILSIELDLDDGKRRLDRLNDRSDTLFAFT